MDDRLKRSLVIVFVVFCALVASNANGAEVLGKKPRHVWGGPSSVSNDQAMLKRPSLHLQGLLRSPVGSCLCLALPLGAMKIVNIVR